MKKGSVLFVGAGPGDPKLLTIKGKEALQRADVVVYDRLANPLLLAHARRGARLVYCGKEADRHTLPQEDINLLLIREAQQGQTVVRLKGGDPSMFGRVGEEAQMCLAHGIPFEIVPGITSGIAAPLYAGIPLTHRDYNSSVAFVTGHLCEKNSGKGPDWAALASVETLVIYMGVKNLQHIREQLLAHGKEPATPVALVRWGTLGKQETLVGTLETIERQVAEARFTAPAIIVVGEVVRLRDSLDWYERKPLFGHTVGVAVRKDETDRLAAVLEELGAEVVHLPLVESNLSDGSGIPADLTPYAWLVFADERQVSFFLRQLRARRYDIRHLQGKIAARGSRTAEALEQNGVYPKLVLDEATPLQTVQEALPLGRGDRILLMDSRGSKVVLHSQGTAMHVVQAGVLEWDRTHPAASWLSDGRVDWVATDDPYALPALAAFFGGGWETRPIVCVGSETAVRAKEMGWSSVIDCPEGADGVVRQLGSIRTACMTAIHQIS